MRESSGPDARPRIVEIPPPTDDDVATLLDRIIARVTAVLTRLGHLDDTDEAPDPQLALAMRPSPRAGGERAEEEPPPLCARQDGFSLHAATAVHKNDRAGLERLARYGLRPPLAQGRLSRAEDGTVVYRMKRVFSDGTAVQRFTPRDFVRRLCARVPPPRTHMVRYAGIFAPNARGRFALTGRGRHDAPPPKTPAPPAEEAAPPAKEAAPPPTDRRPHEDAPDDPTRARRLDWATLMRRSHGVDVLRCPQCGDRMELISTIEDPEVVRRILDHLGVPPRPKPRPPPERPPRPLSLFGDLAIDPPSLFN